MIIKRNTSTDAQCALSYLQPAQAKSTFFPWPTHLTWILLFDLVAGALGCEVRVAVRGYYMRWHDLQLWSGHVQGQLNYSRTHSVWYFVTEKMLRSLVSLIIREWTVNTIGISPVSSLCVYTRRRIIHS